MHIKDTDPSKREEMRHFFLPYLSDKNVIIIAENNCPMKKTDIKYPLICLELQ